VRKSEAAKPSANPQPFISFLLVFTGDLVDLIKFPVSLKEKPFVQTVFDFQGKPFFLPTSKQRMLLFLLFF
jgi:hypothetical protein